MAIVAAAIKAEYFIAFMLDPFWVGTVE